VSASSSSIYGDAETFPTNENALPRPISPYGTTKLAAEHLTYLYWRNYGVPSITLRYFTVYGPRQRPDMAFNLFIRAMLEDRPITIYGDGEQTRDFTFVSDAVDANLATGLSEAVGCALNIGGGSRVTVNH
jgi:nucleoside-diphosphate-sugar epimerase